VKFCSHLVEVVEEVKLELMRLSLFGLVAKEKMHISVALST
jgi:hypothetical protein